MVKASTNIKQPAVKWYQQDIEVDIIDPDGWRFGSVDQQRYNWYHLPITKVEYLQKRARSTTSGFGTYHHLQPFDSSPSTKIPGSRGGHCVLPIGNESLSSSDESSEEITLIGPTNNFLENCLLL